MKEKLILERLEKKYAQLMKKSFELSVKNPVKGEECHRKADLIFEEIQLLSEKKRLSV